MEIKKKITATVDNAIDAELAAAERQTGLSKADMARIGLMKVLRELRETGQVKVEKLEPMAA